ncbi:hypothetical protein HPB51_022085 [Rhipicephalus microplus]|uniref:Uncharacterized protein n=1 Tax=Rhipicephalus microplus TaxID=6941 RepID=A0A9J6EIL5_RHIMP|nr:hypothetical protein HPB51_022085 [Rhipicephalus microplus]
MVIRRSHRPRCTSYLTALTFRLVAAGVMAGTPRQLRLGVSSVPGCQVGVFACDLIPKDTQMGPYPGARKPAVALCRDPSLVWEVRPGHVLRLGLEESIHAGGTARHQHKGGMGGPQHLVAQLRCVNQGASALALRGLDTWTQWDGRAVAQGP